MFERLTPDARAALVAAHDVALELHSDDVGVGHILYGCTEGREDTAGAPLRNCGLTGVVVRRLLPRTDRQPPPGAVHPEALRSVGVDYDGVRAAVEATFGVGALDDDLVSDALSRTGTSVAALSSATLSQLAAAP